MGSAYRERDGSQAAPAGRGLAPYERDVNEGTAALRNVTAPAYVTGQPHVTQAGKPQPKPPKARHSNGERFRVDEQGVYFTALDNEGREKPPVWLCAPLQVTAQTRNAEGQNWGLLLEFTDPEGFKREWAMPKRMLAGDGTEFRATLLDMGLSISPSPLARSQLATYVQTSTPDTLAYCTDRLGWHGSAYVLPRETLGEGAERVVYQTDGATPNQFSQSGTAAEWREQVGRLCVGNTRLVFAASTAFAAPLLHLSGQDSGGFHLRGDSSCGKTTALRVAASVYGGGNYVQRWRATDNALEAIAAQHSDGLLILDELAQIDPQKAGECAYMLANGQSKARSSKTGQAKARLTWRVLFLSAGEIGLAQHMAEGGKRARAGQELRLADVPADAGAGLGIFDTLHQHGHGAELATALAEACDAFHGSVGRTYLEWLVANMATLPERLRQAVDALAADWIKAGDSGQVQRVGRRFALVAAAGELATEAGLTGWPVGEATRGAKACFDAWVDARGGTGHQEAAQMISQVRAFIAMHGESRFADWDQAAKGLGPVIHNRVGFRKAIKDSQGMPTGAQDYYFLPDAFREQVAQGFDPKAMLRTLKEHGHLKPDSGRPFDRSARLPGIGKTNCYLVESTIFNQSCD